MDWKSCLQRGIRLLVSVKVRAAAKYLPIISVYEYKMLKRMNRIWRVFGGVVAPGIVSRILYIAGDRVGF